MLQRILIIAFLIVFSALLCVCDDDGHDHNDQYDLEDQHDHKDHYDHKDKYEHDDYDDDDDDEDRKHIEKTNVFQYSCNANANQSSAAQDLENIKTTLSTLTSISSNHSLTLKNNNELIQNDTTTLKTILSQLTSLKNAVSNQQDQSTLNNVTNLLEAYLSNAQQQSQNITSALDNLVRSDQNLSISLSNDISNMQSQFQNQTAALEQILNSTQSTLQNLVSDIHNLNNLTDIDTNNLDFTKSIDQFTNCLFNCALNTTLFQNQTSIVVSNINSTITNTPMQAQNITLQELQYCYANVTITLTDSLGCASLLNNTTIH
ncbi:hypothetical protein INT43_001655 [Umbelopsis isabellina]|uniref:Uncharacterized protein n=1 Tax=Mortierella isabellina TaxID=91625 RepID=A0A8H7UGY1_MORIS|nr:hypothetical protein INT43_001655 [Umbelopsis isabellina]